MHDLIKLIQFKWIFCVCGCDEVVLTKLFLRTKYGSRKNIQFALRRWIREEIILDTKTDIVASTARLGQMKFWSICRIWYGWNSYLCWDWITNDQYHKIWGEESERINKFNRFSWFGCIVRLNGFDVNDYDNAHFAGNMHMWE